MTAQAEALADSVAPEGVHAHIPQRPDFTSTSRPSVDDVANLTMSTARAVVGAVGGSLPQHLFDYAVTITEVGTAAKVEQSYFPEQISGGPSGAAALLWDEYNDGVKRLVAQILSGQDTGSFHAGSIRTGGPTFGTPRVFSGQI